MGLNANNLCLAVEGETYLDGVSFELPASGFYTVVGRTQAGKTTLLRVLAGLQTVDRGELQIDGRDMSAVPAWQRRVAMVYQQFINYPHLDVFENIAFPLRRAAVDALTIARTVKETAALLGLEPMLQRRPGALSGGQQQRVALARALVKQSDVLLLDEPLVNLDYKLREQLRDEFRTLFRQDDGRIVVYATTEPQEAMLLNSEVLVMHEGRLLQAGFCQEVYNRPQNVTVAQVFNDPPMNLLQGCIADEALWIGEIFSTDVPPHLLRLPPGPYTFGIRAADIHLCSDGLRGEVRLAEINGSETLLHIAMENLDFVIEQEGVHHYDLGDRAEFRFDWQCLYAFAPTGDLLAAPVESERLSVREK